MCVDYEKMAERLVELGYTARGVEVDARRNLDKKLEELNAQKEYENARQRRFDRVRARKMRDDEINKKQLTIPGTTGEKGAKNAK